LLRERLRTERGACIAATAIAKVLVILFLRCCPTTPSRRMRRKAGILVSSNCITILAVMKGVIPRANTDALVKGPPENSDQRATDSSTERLVRRVRLVPGSKTAQPRR